MAGNAIETGDTVGFHMSAMEGEDLRKFERVASLRGTVVHAESGAVVVRWSGSAWIYVYAADRLTVHARRAVA